MKSLMSHQKQIRTSTIFFVCEWKFTIKKHTKGFRPKRGAHDALRQCQKGYWRMAQVLNSVIINKIIAKLGYISMLDYYLTVCEN